VLVGRLTAAACSPAMTGGERFALYDSLTAAITELDDVRTLLDAVLVEPLRPTAARGSLARLNEIRDYMAANDRLFSITEAAGVDAGDEERQRSRINRNVEAGHGRPPATTGRPRC
jgi:hypothetical protein